MIVVSSTIRPRWTIKYFSCLAIVLYSAYCLLLGMPLFSSPLPDYSGPYEVGTIDLEVPCDKRKIGNVVFKDTREPAFILETVLFSLYYPAVKGIPSQKPHHPWLSPISLKAEGYARFARINNFLTNGFFSFVLWTLAGSTTIPANVDVPLHGTAKTFHDNYDAEPPMDEYGLPKFPVIIFSHGMASSRTDYTQYCGELASRGFVVAALEHRDGSGPGTLVMNPSETKPVFHINPNMLDPVPEVADFKVLQLAMRQAEVEETVRVLRDINNGRGLDLFGQNPRLEGQDLAQWKDRLNLDRVVVGGHSYGATLALQTLKGAPSEKLPFKGAIILDPGKHSGPLNDDINVPTLIVHSQSWSKARTIFQGRPHFGVVKDLVKKIIEEKHTYSWFMTSRGTTHPSVTDAPLIEPFLLSWTTGSTIDARQGVLEYVMVSQQFMHYLDTGHRQSILKEDITHQEYDDPNPRPFDPKLAKYWQIHMAPSTKCPAPGLCGLENSDGD